MSDLYTKEQAETYITDRISEAELYSTQASTLFSNFMQSLGSAANTIADVPFAETPNLNISEYVAGTLSQTAPIWAGTNKVEVTLPTIQPLIPIAPFGDVAIPDNPEVVDAPSSEVMFVEQEYVSSVLTDVKAFLSAGFAGSSGIGADVEQAIYDRDRIRRELESEKAYNATLEQFSGYDIPPGALSSALQRVAEDRTRLLADHSNDIMVQASNLEQENKKIFTQYAIQLESILVDQHDKRQTRALEAEKTRLQMALSVWTSSLDRYKTLMEAAKIEADVNIAKLNSQALTNKAISDGNIANIEYAKASIELELGAINAEVKSFAAQVSSFEVSVKQYIAVEGAKSGAYEANVAALTQQVEMAVKAADVNIQAVIAVRTILLEAAKSGSAVSAQVLASSLNSINAAVSYGYSGSINSSHSYDETKGKASGTSTSNIHTWDETGV